MSVTDKFFDKKSNYINKNYLKSNVFQTKELIRIYEIEAEVLKTNFFKSDDYTLILSKILIMPLDLRFLTHVKETMIGALVI